jgi:hypothetical protein
MVAEAAHDLEVAIGPGDHQQLLEDLRRLRQRVELAGVDAARHQEVARAFRRRLRQDRRLDFPEAVGVEVLPDCDRDAVPQADVVLQARPAQIEVAVLEADVFRNRAIFGDLERRRPGFVEQADLARQDLDLAGGQFRVDRLGRAALHHARDPNHELGAEPLGDGHQRVVFADHDLRDARAIADVEEGDAAQVADAVHPAKDDDALADIVVAQRAAGVGSLQISEMLCHERF